MRKLVVLALTLVAALALAPPAFAQTSEVQYCTDPEDCIQTAQSFEAASAAAAEAAAAAGAASAAAGDGASATVDGEVAFRAALDAARDTGVDEDTARTVATQAVASVSASPQSEPSEAEAAEEPKPRTEKAEPRTERGTEEPSGGNSQERQEDEGTSSGDEGASDDDEPKVLPATGGTLSEMALAPALLALLVGAGLVLRQLVR
jgi:hypothetical protein